tara:strand:+ start:1073 stop:1681 length:609 start_codon:yes stop_codon:yes gene_type:complete
MASIKLQGDTSGELTISAPAVAGTNTLTLPTTTGTLATTADLPAGLDDVGGVARATSGLLFNADTAAANTLDDYEEGTFTPTMLFGGASVGVVYNQQLGFYTKVGDIVHCTVRMVLTNKGSSTGNATIGGLPFVNKNTSGNYPTASMRLSSVSFADVPCAYMDINSTSLFLNETTNAGVASALTNANWQNGSNTMFSITYKV